MMDVFALIELGKLEYEQRLRDAEAARRVLRSHKAKQIPPLWRILWLLFF